MADDLYVTADLHFNHKGIIYHCGRPHESVREMNEAIIEAWNSTVPRRADIYVLGDFGFDQRGDRHTTQELGALFDRLEGNKHLVIGNHDEANPAVLKLPWKTQSHLVSLKRNGLRAVACHYPLLTWKHAHRGWKMLHGHSHGTLRHRHGGRLDVGWDVFGRPLTLTEACEAAGEYEPVDHHEPK